MNILEIELSNISDPDIANSVVIHLPATWAELNDALQKARIPDDSVIYKLDIWDSEPESLMQLIPENTNLQELNFLAQRLDKMQKWQLAAFEGLTMMDVIKNSYAPIPIARLINMTYSLADCHAIYEACDDRSLGKFYADNGFVTELENISENIFNWLDYDKIGKYMREAEGGVFTPSGYVAQTGEISEEYSFETAVFEQKPDYVFLLEIAKAPMSDYPNEECCATLKLPADTDHILKALAEVDANSLQDCVFYRFDSLVPSLSNIFANMDDFKELNALAVAIQAIDENGALAKFKALIEAVNCYDIVPLTELARDLDSYSFSPKALTPSDYAISIVEKLDIPMKDKLFNASSLNFYGMALMEQNNLHNTDYGFISRKDGEPIFSQDQQCHSMTMQF